MKKMHILLMSFAIISLLILGCGKPTNPVDVRLSEDSGVSSLAKSGIEFYMNDRFAAEKGASGSGEVKVGDGSVEIEVEAEDLLPNHAYELRVTVGPQGAPFQSGFFVVTFGPVTSNKNGKIEFDDEELDLAPGSYRLDLFVTHDHEMTPPGTISAIPEIGGNRDPLFACAPAPMVTIPLDDDDDELAFIFASLSDGPTVGGGAPPNLYDWVRQVRP